ncbi:MULTISPECIES: FxLYD domain-containing protein [Clostridium]|uniref:FxLYD domain-containing protein n=1 Tax=Clostridium lapidicellarium TaxID=3240931 RepID=A0ABV4DXG8_9CLOT
MSCKKSENTNENTIKIYNIRQALKENIREDQLNALALEKSTDNRAKNSTKAKIHHRVPFYKNKNITLPLLSAVLALSFTCASYFYETHISKYVEKNRIAAENMALQGNISGACSLVDRASNLRPNNKTLKADKIFLQDGKTVDLHINIADNYIKDKNYNMASNELDEAANLISDKAGNFYSLLNKNIENKRMDITVLQIKNEMNNKSSIEDLAELLNKISNYNVKEAGETALELRKRISTVAYNTANEYLKKNDFTSALQTINKGIVYNPGDKKLIKFKQVVISEKNSFETAEKTRIQNAIASAALEDKNNKTNAVQVISSSTDIDKYGDLTINGTVKNIATKPVSSIQIYYTIYDCNNVELGNDSTYVYPNQLSVNETGKFENTEYKMPKGHHFKITKITWSLPQEDSHEDK